MSVKAMNAAVRVSAPSHTAKLVMMILAHHHNAKTGRCFPSYERIAEEAGLAKSSVTRAIKELVDSGLIEKVKGRRAGSFNAPNTYKLKFLTHEALLPKERHKGYDRHGRAALPDREAPSPTAKASGEVAARPLRKQRAAPKRRISEHWQPGPKDRAYAVEQGFANDDLKKLIEDFRDYWLAQGSVKSSWGAAFRRWTRRQVEIKAERDERNARTGPARRGDERLDDLASSLRAAAEAGRRAGGS